MSQRCTKWEAPEFNQYMLLLNEFLAPGYIFSSILPSEALNLHKPYLHDKMYNLLNSHHCVGNKHNCTDEKTRENTNNKTIFKHMDLMDELAKK